MTPDEIKAARKSLGLSVAELAALMDIDAHGVRRVEMRENAATARKPPARFVRLLRAYLAGYRPPDWPEGRTAENAGV